MTALKVVVGDEGAALNAVQAYFAGPFKEQIVSSGEQPFESTRTRAYHYRAFNLEAMMVRTGLYLDTLMHCCSYRRIGRRQTRRLSWGKYVGHTDEIQKHHKDSTRLLDHS